MPDTTPERPVIGVRVHFNDGRAPVLHSNARQFREDETSGVLRVYAGSKQIAVHASMEWAWAELVHGEAETPPSAPTITTPGPAVSVSSTPVVGGTSQGSKAALLANARTLLLWLDVHDAGACHSQVQAAMTALRDSVRAAAG